jgi:hypothetical protein
MTFRFLASGIGSRILWIDWSTGWGSYRKGDLIGHIRDLGRRGPYERAYATNEDLGFHTDSTDFVGLMCLRPAL